MLSQNLITDSERNRHRLLLHIGAVVDILEILKGRVAGILYQFQKFFEIPISQSLYLSLNSSLDVYKRQGDHAVNVAEWVQYSITGIHKSDEHHLDTEKE